MSWHRRCGWAVVAAAWLAGSANLPHARGEEGEAKPAPDPALRADDQYPDTYINDSFEAGEMLATAARLSEQHRWDEAARLLDRVSAKFGDKLIRRAPGRYGPVSDRVHELLGAWPPEGLAVYRGLFEAEARRRFATTAATRDAAALAELLERYTFTATGVEIADTLAQIHVEAGAFGSAERIYGELLTGHPDVRAAPQRIRGRLAVVAALAGNREAALRWSAPTVEGEPPATVRWMGQDRPLPAVIDGLLAHVADTRPGDTPFTWPTFGGGNDRNGAVDFRVDDAASLWHADGVAAGFAALPPASERSPGYARALEDGRFLSSQPVAAGELVFLQDAVSIRALRAETGVLAWTYPAARETSDRRGDGDDGVVAWYGVTYADGRVFAVFGDDAAPYYGDAPGSTPSRVVCLDARTGEELWQTHEAGLEEAFSRCLFDPTPLVADGQVYVVARRRRSFGFEDCYLCRFNADTGALEFRTHLGGASTGGFGFRRATMSVPALAGDAIVLTTNLGTIAAVDTDSGRVRWLTLYKRDVGTPWGTGRGGATAPWYYNPVLIDAERIVCCPLDRDALLVLDAATGALRAAVPTGQLANLVSVVGVRAHVLYGVGDTVIAYDLAEQRLRWTAPLPPEQRVYGRALLTADRVLVPTPTLLCSYALDGTPGNPIRWESAEDAGNVVALPDRLIIAGNARLSAYARKPDVWGRLQARMAAAPTDPAPALEMSEVALRGGDVGAARDALEEAIRRAGGFTAVVDAPLKHRLFDGCLALAEKIGSGESADRDAAMRLLGYAAQCAPDVAGEIAYRVRLAALQVEAGRPEAAVELYQQIIGDRSLRGAPAPPEGAAGETAGTLSRRQIDRLIEQHGRPIYARCEARAIEWLEAGTRANDLAALERVVEGYPNAEAAPRALIESSRLLRQAGKPLDAVRRLTTAYRQYGEQIDGAAVLRAIADCYVEAGQPETAWCWLTKALRRYPAGQIEVGGQRLSFEAYRARLGDVRARVEPAHPAMRLPLATTFVREFEGACHLLEPLYAELPQTAWDACYIYSDAQIYSLDAARNQLRWDQPAPCRMKPELLSATAERAVFATRHQVLALDPRDGQRLWEYGAYPADLANDLKDHEMFATFRVHAVGRDRVVSFEDNGTVACLVAATGAPQWQKSLAWRANGPVALSDAWVAFGAQKDGDDVCVVLDLATGETLSVVQLPAEHRAERLFAVLGDLVVVTTQSIHCYDPFTGAPAWEVQRERHILTESVRTDLDGVYFSDDGRHVEKLDLDRGRTVWRSERLPIRSAEGLAAVLDADQLIVSTETNLQALDAFDGRLLWEGTVPPRALFGMRAVTQGYVVVVDTRGGKGQEPYVAYFFDHRRADGRIAADGGVRDLGSFEGFKHLAVRDHALLLATEHTVYGWTAAAEGR